MKVSILKRIMVQVVDETLAEADEMGGLCCKCWRDACVLLFHLKRINKTSKKDLLEELNNNFFHY